MRNLEVAGVLREIADRLEVLEVEHKPRAYRRAADNIEAAPEDVVALHERGELDEVEGVGEAIAGKVGEYLETGTIGHLEELRTELPVDVPALALVEGLGPSRVRTLHDELGIADLDDLEEAAAEGRVAEVPGFGPKTQETILSSVDHARRARRRVLLGDAIEAMDAVLEDLEDATGVDRVEPAGGLRRRVPSLDGVDLVAAGDDPEAVLDAFEALPYVGEVLDRRSAGIEARVAGAFVVALDVHPNEDWGWAWIEATGSPDHVTDLREHAWSRGLDGVPGGATEEEVYGAVDLPAVPPELREGLGEVEAARDGELPDLVAVDDLRGDLQMHTTWSDGAGSVEEMAREADELGHEYILITDHGPSLEVAGGPDEEDLAQQAEEVAAADDAFDVRVLHGVEANVTSDGGLDVSDDALEDLDLVVAALHRRTEDATDLLVSAVEDHPVDVVAHPTNRRLLQRPGNDLDLEALAEACAGNGVALEINAQADRLDLDWRAARQLRGEVPIVVNTDAHSPEGLQRLGLGVTQARKAWLEPRHVLNTRPLDEVLEALGA